MIVQLKKEIQRLKADLAIATGQEYTGELTEDELERYVSCFTVRTVLFLLPTYICKYL